MINEYHDDVDRHCVEWPVKNRQHQHLRGRKNRQPSQLHQHAAFDASRNDASMNVSIGHDEDEEDPRFHQNFQKHRSLQFRGGGKPRRYAQPTAAYAAKVARTRGAAEDTGDEARTSMFFLKKPENFFSGSQNRSGAADGVAAGPTDPNINNAASRVASLRVEVPRLAPPSPRGRGPPVATPLDHAPSTWGSSGRGGSADGGSHPRRTTPGRKAFQGGRNCPDSRAAYKRNPKNGIPDIRAPVVGTGAEKTGLSPGARPASSSLLSPTTAIKLNHLLLPGSSNPSLLHPAWAGKQTGPKATKFSVMDAMERSKESESTNADLRDAGGTSSDSYTGDPKGALATDVGAQQQQPQNSWMPRTTNTGNQQPAAPSTIMSATAPPTTTTFLPVSRGNLPPGPSNPPPKSPLGVGHMATQTVMSIAQSAAAVAARAKYEKGLLEQGDAAGAGQLGAQK